MALDDDATAALEAFARDNRFSLGKAASVLIRRGFEFRLATKKVNGLPVFDVPAGFPAVTSRQIQDILADE